jgi:DNA-binding transcriptional LysR family regulator
MRGELSEYAEGLRGRVRLFANTTATAEFLPATLAAFLSQHPQIDIDLEERSSRDIVRPVTGNLADIGIVGNEVNPAKELQTFPFAEDRLVLIAPRDHAVSHQRAIAFRDALAYDHVGLPAGNALQDQIEDHAAERAVAMYSLIETAKLNGVNPQAYLADVLARIADHPAKRGAELLPWNWQAANPIRAAA